MFFLSKSYKLLRFLNRQPGPVLRAGISAIAWLCTLLFTGRLVLASGVFAMIWRKRDLKRGLRRVAWFASRSRLRLEVVSDPVFDVSEGMSLREVQATQAFLEGRRDTSLRGAMDLLTLKAASLRPPMAMTQWDMGMKEFSSLANRLLAEPMAATPPTPGETRERQGDFPVDAAANALRDFADLFPNTEIPWFLVSGTFLGAVREGDFLPHDYDIDLGVREDVSLQDMAKRVASDPRFSVIGTTDQEVLVAGPDGMGSHSTQVLLKLLHRDGVHVDVFAHILDGVELWHGSQLHRWDNKDFALVPYPLAGISVFGAADADLYLTENYGDWRTPRTGFNPSTGTPNLRIVHNLASLVLFLKRYALARQECDIGSERIAELMEEGGYIMREGSEWRFNPAVFRQDLRRVT
ncbi:MAG: LicD family protein [Pseudomonadota bacterium]